jgi:CDP-diacylglycerol---glycerol-3-phosphate 3-phosphatidyltransferase
LLTLSNSLSFFRAPLAFLFLAESVPLRLLAIALAMITDSVDGYLARKNKTAGRFGAILDPAMDKFFVTFALCVLYFEAKLALLQAIALLSRDCFLVLYGLFVAIFGRWRAIELRAIRWGKITTALQFIALMGLAIGIDFPWTMYGCFIGMGFMAFLELLQLSNPFAKLTH